MAGAAPRGSTRNPKLAEMIPLEILIGVKITHQKASNQIAARDIDVVLSKKTTSEVFLPEMMYYKNP